MIDETGSRLAQIVFDRLGGVEITKEYVQERLCKTCYKGEIQTRIVEQVRSHDAAISSINQPIGDWLDLQEGPGCQRHLSPICIEGGLCPYYKYSNVPIKHSWER